LQGRREAKAPSLIVRVLGDGVSEEKELVVLRRLIGISHRLCSLTCICRALTMSTMRGCSVRRWYYQTQSQWLALVDPEISPALRRGRAANVKCFNCTIRQAHCNGREIAVRGLSKIGDPGTRTAKVVTVGSGSARTAPIGCGQLSRFTILTVVLAHWTLDFVMPRHACSHHKDSKHR
jgi:hypothetical protein